MSSETQHPIRLLARWNDTNENFLVAGNQHRYFSGSSNSPGRVRHSATVPEITAVPPRRKFRSQRFADSYQICSFPDASEAYLIGRTPENRSAKETLTVFDCLPPLLQRSEVPSAAFRRDGPQSSLR